MARITLQEFFHHSLVEGPRDTTFKPAPEVKPVTSSETDAPEADLAPTQDMAPLESSKLDFFAKNVQSAADKFADLANEGFDTGALLQFASALDQLVGQMYQGIQEPAERQDFEVEAQKVAGDLSKDLSKVFEKVLKLRAYGQQY
ncbi:MAG: hypothetical protein A2139_08025 [Desulfobacca sp. RBG_16_60_12]|nr:MAG: hypothetical protein A2139_08025 [Desulfobacca sp. RBG_16_60_12]